MCAVGYFKVRHQHCVVQCAAHLADAPAIFLHIHSVPDAGSFLPSIFAIARAKDGVHVKFLPRFKRYSVNQPRCFGNIEHPVCFSIGRTRKRGGKFRNKLCIIARVFDGIFCHKHVCIWFDGCAAFCKHCNFELIGKALRIHAKPIRRFRVNELSRFFIVCSRCVFRLHLKRCCNGLRLRSEFFFINGKRGAKSARTVCTRVILRNAERFEQHIVQIRGSAKLRRIRMCNPLPCADLILQRCKVCILLRKQCPARFGYFHAGNIHTVDFNVLPKGCACTNCLCKISIFLVFATNKQYST